MPTTYINTEEEGTHTLTWYERNFGTSTEQAVRDYFSDTRNVTTLSGSRAKTVNETHTGIRPEDNVTRDADQGGTTTILRAGETSEPTDMSTDTSGDPVEQATRLLSGAGGGGPTGQATEGVNPSAGSISGTSGSVLPVTVRPRDLDGSAPDRVAMDRFGGGMLGLPVVALVALIALFLALLGR